MFDSASRAEKGGISMYENSRERAKNMITMEEYLRKRQVIKNRECNCNTEGELESEHVLKLTELLYV